MSDQIPRDVTPPKPLGEHGALAALADRYATAPAADEPGRQLKPHRRLHPGLDCTGMLREVDRDEHLVVARCDGCGYETSFKPEVVDRQIRVTALLRRAHLPARFIDTPLPQHPGTVDARAHLGAFLDGWPDGPKPPFLHGLYGRGKTHLLTRMARAFIERHEVRLRYLTIADLLDEAKRAMDARQRDRAADTTQQVFDRAARVQVLVLDDLTELRTDWQRDVLEQLVDRRYRGTDTGPLPVMGATNVPVADWPGAFGPRVASRLLELTHPVHVQGPDWRTR